MSRGPLFWVSAWMHVKPYLDGHELDYFEADNPPSWEDQGGMFVIPTHGGTDVTQSLYLGDARGLEVARQRFNVRFLMSTEEDYFRIERAKRRAAPVLWVPFAWTEEVFDVTGGETYRLQRPVAWGLGSATAVAHPCRFFLDDVEDPTAVTISGTTPQTFTANETGVLAIRYLPAFRVRVSEVRRELETVNGLVVSAELDEIVRES